MPTGSVFSYPRKESTSLNWLTYYFTTFNCVEVNSTFYAYMSDKVVNSWIRKTANLEDFTFTVKLHQDFTIKGLILKKTLTQLILY